MTVAALLPAEEETAEVTIGDIRLTYRRNDGGGTHYLGRTHSEEYHSPLWPLLRAALAPELCVDIGANYGYTGLLMRRAFPDSRLALVEPVPWLEAYIRHNFASNGQSFDAFHSAICSVPTPGDRSGFGMLERGTQDSRVIPQPGTVAIETGVVTLDALTADVAPGQRVYVKIDTQGWEERVFAGGEAFLTGHGGWFVKTEFAPEWLESQGSDPVALLRWLLKRFAVHENAGRTGWKTRSLAGALGVPLEQGDEAAFVDYVRNLALKDKGWVDLYILPPESRRDYDIHAGSRSAGTGQWLARGDRAEYSSAGAIHRQKQPAGRVANDRRPSGKEVWMTDRNGTPQPSERLMLFVWAGAEPNDNIQNFSGALPHGATVLEHDARALGKALQAGKPCAVIWSRPEAALAGALAAGLALGPVLTQWQEQATGLLDLYRHNRRRLVLLSDRTLTTTDPLARTQLRERLGLKEDFSVQPAATGADDPATLLAVLAVPQLDELRPLLTELEAGSILCAPPGINAACLERAGALLAQDLEKQALLADQTGLMQQELEGIMGRMETDRTRHEAERARLEAELAAMHKTLIARENTLTVVQAELDAIYASHSWKVTTPMRDVRRFFGRLGS